MPLAEARALVEHQSTRNPRRRDPFFVEHDPAADRTALQQLARDCDEYTPIYGLEEAESPECLLLDVTGCLALFESEQALAEQIRSDFQEHEWEVRVAMAPTIGGHQSGQSSRGRDGG
jgi:protein ImuB